MRIGRFSICFLISASLIYILNNKIGALPPLGKILDPVNGFMANAENVAIPESEVLKLPAAGTVYFDDRLVPHIFANNNHDLYFLQGYITASYRLWQMDIQTRAAAGRLSEILGKDLIEYDTEQRSTGMVWAAENALAELKKDSDTYACVTAYAEGVNYFIHSLNYARFPIEYKLLDYKPEEWTILKSLLLLKYMASDLTGFDDDIEYTNNLKLLGKKDFEVLFPDRPQGIVPIIPSEKKYDFIPEKTDTSEIKIAENYYNTTNTFTTHKHEDNVTGSNNWVLDGTKTQNGNPILCNDPHLALNLPSLWFEIQLNSPSVNCYGASLPGAPAIVIGFNDSIAWGVTNAGRDVRDWYTIEFKNSDKKEYKYGNIYVATTSRLETIKVRGEKDIIDTVIYTQYGPIVFNGSEKNIDNIPYKKQRINLAMRWSAHDASSDFKTFYLLNRATNYDSYKAALNYFSCPAQNFIFACTNGDIAITQQGKFAIKYPEEGRFVLNGADPKNTWTSYIPNDENPTIKNPSQGFLVSANQHPTDSTYPYYYTSFDFEFYRNRVINASLQNMQHATIDDMEKLQQNNYNLLAAEALPVMLGQLNENNSVSNALKQWDNFNDADKTEPVYFQIWWDTLYNLLWDEFYDTTVSFIKPNYYNTVQAIKNLPNDYTYFDIAATKNKKETLHDILNLSFNAANKTIDSLKNKNTTILKWYAYKHTSIMHIAQIAAFSQTTIHNGGYKNIVNASSETHGPSWRMVVELSKPIQAFGVYPGGQSGNPGSKYYDNFISDWANGKYYQLNFFDTKKTAESKSLFSKTYITK